MSTELDVNGNTYTWPDDFQAYKYVQSWPALLGDCFAQFSTDIAAGTDQALAAADSAAESAASANTATMSPATQATSSTSLTISTGVKTLTVQTGKGFMPGMQLRSAKSDGTRNFMDGTCLSYNSGLGQLMLDVTQVIGAGTFNSWNVFLEGPVPIVNIEGGGSTTTSATSINHTAASPRSMSVTMTAQGQSIVLDDATTYTLGGPILSVSNSGQNAFAVRRKDMSILTVVPPGGAGDIYLDGNATARGVWHATGQGLMAAMIYTPAINFANTLACSVSGFWQVGNSIILLGAPSGSSTSLYAQAIDISQTPAVVGAPVLISAVFNGSVGGAFTNLLTASALDSTHVLVAFGSTVPSMVGVVLTLTSASSISPGSPATIITGALNSVQAVCVLSASLAVITYILSSGGTALAVAVPITGATIGTAGTPVAMTGSNTLASAQNKANNFPVGAGPIVAASTASFVWGAASTSGTFFYAGATVSGVTIALGAIHSVGGGSNGGFMPLGSNTFLLAAGGTSTQNYVAMTLSGNTVTPGTGISDTNVFAAPLALAQFSPTSIGVLMSTLWYMALSISGTTITLSKAATGLGVAIGSGSYEIQASQIIGWTGPLAIGGRIGLIEVTTLTATAISVTDTYLPLPPAVSPMATPVAAGNSYGLYVASTIIGGPSISGSNAALCFSFSGNTPAYLGYATGVASWTSPWSLASTQFIIGAAANANAQLMEIAS